ncbi:uncharacterized protein LOC110985971 [Acanthaster planci]|uniref:Uncharacterized protein LOC110985971 n=1 Tax=Acanthaster planci TaxID=133434 RepID=A0A8B7ZC11_ACAPL|nr:uncharacterized protein LOC110985971 [Acanthaster planci]XP_022103199.1 uncharacterized protein LOC110985971 [Acanthaster planci]XP_022103200.1 uncharacterized protein LOC110985971 [Acanthaster planci]XP_022103201.1 uncharacterized protein LOC110985971 [Acanthaster planci]XP_022103202.1 uncharacterized protein LOC110985971 [Acanthaster planci]XP_022103203.1 uncharacterized protein LOC110985971 [Acanthaster planci]
MDKLIVSGLVVDGLMNVGYHHMVLTMEPDSTSRQLDKKSKEEIKREKNRESSARSRKRKRDEDERNQTEIERLEGENRQLRERAEALLEEGRVLREQVDPYFLDNPLCKGCAPKEEEEIGNAAEGTSQQGLEPPFQLLPGFRENEPVEEEPGS